jgi:hypothetical protein
MNGPVISIFPEKLDHSRKVQYPKHALSLALAIRWNPCLPWYALYG